MSLALLTCLTAFSAVVAVSIALRMHPSGRAELLVAATLAWNGLILVPIYGLGWAHRLTAGSLAWTSGGLFVAALALSSYRVRSRDQARAIASALGGLARLPWDALVLAARPVSFGVVAVLAAEASILWSALSAYYGHAWRMWDSLWYHEPIVAFTIQYHGFRTIALPDSLQRINSLPRVAEMTDLWFAIFAGRRLIDIPNSVLSPALLASQYLLCARFARGRGAALGWASAFFLMPCIVWQLATTFVDLHLALLLLAALGYAVRPGADLRHSALAALALTLAVGVKYQALVPVAAIAVLVLIRTVRVPARRRSRALVTVGGAVAILGFGATTYLANYVRFKNPVWPFLVSGRFHWPGFADRGQDVTKPGVVIGQPGDEVVKGLFSAPLAAFHYGLGFAWVLLPLFALACAVWGAHVVRAMARRSGVWFGLRASVDREDIRSLAIAGTSLLPAIAVAWTSPALEEARYHIFVVGSMLILVAWMTRASRLGGLGGEGAIGAFTVLTLMGYLDADPRYVLSPRELRALARSSPAEREVDPEHGAATYRDVGLARERELGPGDIVAFGDDYGGFPAEFWNDRFSNRVIYVPDFEHLAGKAEALGAKWIYCPLRSPCADDLDKPGSGWASLGELHTQDDGHVYHRVE